MSRSAPNQLSVKQKIARKRRQATVATASNLVTCTCLTIAAYRSHWDHWWFPLLLLTAGLTAFRAWQLRRIVHAQRVYNANPAAAYLVEIENAFGAPTERNS